MLLVLMYHQILNQKEPSNASVFQEHLKYLYNNYPIILPGEPLVKNALNICFTFDDAYLDFYSFIFPLLQKFKISAVLGVPTKFIRDETHEKFQTGDLLCNWKEIKEMVDSGFVKAASHSHSHLDLTDKQIDLDMELQSSKLILEQKLQVNVDTIIYPFGKTSKHVNKTAKQYYKYIMRIGSSLNKDWDLNNGLIYRIDADHLWKENKKITKSFLFFSKLQYWFNIIRNK